MKDLIKIIHDIREKNNCHHIKTCGNPTVIAKLPKDLSKDLELENIKLHEIPCDEMPCDNDTIYIIPALSQPMKYVIENNEKVIFEE